MKKRMLFVMPNMHIGGAEKALVSLLQYIDYSLYEVDLLLFRKEGLLLGQINKNVNILEEPKYYKYFDCPFIDVLKTFNPSLIFLRLLFYYYSSKGINSSIKEQYGWKAMRKIIPNQQEEYDIAIGFLEKIPIYFVVDETNARKKIGFIHNDYNKLGLSKKLDIPYFIKLDAILSVSENCVKVLKEEFPQFSQKISLMYNIISQSVLEQEASYIINDFPLSDFPNIISLGRLELQKGFDLAIDACRIIKGKGVKFKWYIIGDGAEYSSLEKQILNNDLNDTCILLGARLNPYPYLKLADIYVQPSRFEGKSVAIEEAKIFHKPILITDFSTAKDQIADGFNGLICKMTAEDIANKLEVMINDTSLRNTLSHNLSTEDYGTVDEIYKLYELIEN